MFIFAKRDTRFRNIITSGIALASLVAYSAEAQPVTAPTIKSPYTLSIFATGANGNTQPDSIARWEDSVLVAYQNGAAKDGSDGKSSAIVQYSLAGKVQRVFHVRGHNDGLRLVGGDSLWAVQNEDANPNLVVIDLKTGTQKNYTFPAPVHGGGYDDFAVLNGQVYVSASNPTLDSKGKNVFPALLRINLVGSTVQLEPVLEGSDDAIDIPTGKPVTLNLTDPDSLTVDPRGNLVLDSQADSELIFVHEPLTEYQTAGRLPITLAGQPVTLDDTAFAASPKAFLLVADVKANAVYRIEAPRFGFEPGTAYSSSDTAGIVGTLDLDTGVVTPIATGFISTRGMIFVLPDTDKNKDK